MVLVLIVIGWLYVALMVAVAEASAINGSVLGALVTFVLYGLLPVSIIAYIFSTPARKRLRKAREEQAERQWRQAQQEAAARPVPAPAGDSAVDPDGGGQPPAAAKNALIAPVREEP
ncbi:hypothetical protein [Diaphorobacter aerolatus]|uniref:Uncharacterized protein n=1 Tax=Diaphorobacter aerolatus TaxID=1288495 RepID=A0A7H0GKZ8_9BURK|nr:hypothetical protein [Diaphorobacter aerolatus]QNP48964.1 hypothetical protein H9K75_01900 [Diaphorobacter aerolatus]